MPTRGGTSNREPSEGGRARFLAEAFAPWCERARWALDFHRVAYREEEQVPVLAELTLRLAARRLRGRVTVPLLVDGRTVIFGSDAIARHAEARGGSPSLFPPAHGDELERWMQNSETIMVAGRAVLLRRLARDAAALSEQAPGWVPRVFRGSVARFGVWHLRRKYGVDLASEAQSLDAARACLDELRARRATHPLYLIGDRLTYADVSMAAALQFVLPVADRFIRLGAATRRAWTWAQLAGEYADLLGWRDALYETRTAR